MIDPVGPEVRIEPIRSAGKRRPGHHEGDNARVGCLDDFISLCRIEPKNRQ